MIARAAAPLLDWYAAHRRRQLERLWRDPVAVQEATLRRLVAAARNTEFGLAHGFGTIRSLAQYQAHVPIREYRDFRPLWERARQGERDITWPGRSREWAETAGTTAGSKLIPVTADAFESHRKGEWDAMLQAVSLVGARHLLGGPSLFVGGGTALGPLGPSGRVGDLWGLLMRRLPYGLRRRDTPGPALSAITDWEERIQRVAALAARQDVRLLCGMPSWLVVLFERVARHCQATGLRLRDLGRLWPNLRVLMHGGVSFPPYAGMFEQWMGRALHRVEIYPATEGFVAVQTEPTGGLTLMLDYDIVYEFVPVEDLGGATPRRHTVAEVEVGRPYAVVLTTAGGLWSYLLGDTVRFTARDPLRLVLTGRTWHCANAFGENVIVEEVERALIRACRRTDAEVVEFTVAPRYPTVEEPRGSHEWLVEFRIPPGEPDDFPRILDETLAAANRDYRTKRTGDVGMAAPRVTMLPPGTFYRWMSEAGKLGDRYKVPRATNDRVMAEALLAVAGGCARALVMVAD